MYIHTCILQWWSTQVKVGWKCFWFDALKIFDSGADKISLNTNAVQNPNILSILSKRFGSQAIVLSVEAKKKQKEKWDVYVESGREKND